MEICHRVILGNKTLETTTYCGNHFVIYICVLDHHVAQCYVLIMSQWSRIQVDEDLSQQWVKCGWCIPGNGICSSYKQPGMPM